jgi:hypothetical protein
MEFSVLVGRGQMQLDAQLFKLSGSSLQDMRSVDHMTHMSITSHAANTSFNEVRSNPARPQVAAAPPYPHLQLPASEGRRFSTEATARVLSTRLEHAS